MPIHRPYEVGRRSLSKGINILNTVTALLVDNQHSDQFLKAININNICTTLKADMQSETLYIYQSDIPVAPQPRTLGSKHITYLETYLINLFYYHSMLDNVDINTELIEVRDMLVEFFISHSSLNGLCKMGITVTGRIGVTTTVDGHFWRGVIIDLLVPFVSTRDRNLRG